MRRARPAGLIVATVMTLGLTLGLLGCGADDGADVRQIENGSGSHAGSGSGSGSHAGSGSGSGSASH